VRRPLATTASATGGFVLREFPFRPVAPGTWRVQFDTSLEYRVAGEYYTVYRPVKVAARDAIR
jgi:hypothetical protein